MSFFRIVDRDGEMLADADSLDRVTEVVGKAPPGRYHVDEISTAASIGAHCSEVGNCDTS